MKYAILPFMPVKKAEEIALPKLKDTRFVLIIVILTLVALAYLFRSFFIAAVVNGQPVSRFSLIQELEKQGGKRTLENLIVKALILQEAKKQKVTVDKKEIDAEIAKAESNLAKQSQTLDSVLAMQGLTKEGLEEQIRFEKLIEKLVGKDAQITDKEIEEYLKVNKDSLPESSDAAQLKEQAYKQLQRQKISEKFQSWLAELQRSAKINYFVSY